MPVTKQHVLVIGADRRYIAAVLALAIRNRRLIHIQQRNFCNKSVKYNPTPAGVAS